MPFFIQTVDGLILEKPVDKQDAYRMLSRYMCVCVTCKAHNNNNNNYKDIHPVMCLYVGVISRLSGKEHSVFTGVATVLCQDKEGTYMLYSFR